MSLKVRDTFIDFEGANPSSNADFKGRTTKDTSHTPITSVDNVLIFNSVISTIPDITGSLSQIQNLSAEVSVLSAIGDLHQGLPSPNIIEHQHNQVPLQINYDFGEECVINHFRIRTPIMGAINPFPNFYETIHSFARKIEFSGSNDNSNYTALTEFNNDFLGTSADVNLNKMGKTFSNNTPFRFYKFKISEFGPHPDILDDFEGINNFNTSSLYITEIELENKEPLNQINTEAIITSNFSPPLVTIVNGWNQIGYNVPSPPIDFFDMLVAFFQNENYYQNLDIIKDSAGALHAPNSSATFSGINFIPGEGYAVYAKNLPGGQLTTFFPLDLTELGAPPFALLDFSNVFEYRSFNNINVTSDIVIGWNMIAYPRYSSPPDTFKATYAACVNKPPGSITYNQDLDKYFLNQQEVDIYSLELHGNFGSGIDKLQNIIHLIKNNSGGLLSPPSSPEFSSYNYLPGQGYKVYSKINFTLCFAGDTTIGSLPFIDI